jgi:hypothetical protein
VSTEEFRFPTFAYYVDESEPDIVVLRRQDDAMVAAFSARAATREGIIAVAREDYQELVRIHWAQQQEGTEEHRSADLEPGGIHQRPS